VLQVMVAGAVVIAAPGQWGLLYIGQRPEHQN
jgi:hypothetical protein